MKKFLLAGLLLGMLSGCYTQFSTLEEKAPPPPKVTYEFDSATGDTVKVYSPIDTIARGANQTCYWTRNIWGEPELRCDNSSYSQDWYLYNDYPWWYNRDSYIYDAYGRCPRYYYYDESCRSCRYYSDRGSSGNYYGNSSGYGSGGGRFTPTPVNANATVRHTRSSGVPNSSTVSPSSNATLSKQTTNVSGGSVSQSAVEQADLSRRKRSSAIPNGQTIPEAPASNTVSTPLMGTQADVQAPVAAPQTSQGAGQSPPPSPDQTNTNVQSSPSPSSPPSNSNDQNNNNRNRRNPRSW